MIRADDFRNRMIARSLGEGYGITRTDTGQQQPQLVTASAARERMMRAQRGY